MIEETRDFARLREIMQHPALAKYARDELPQDARYFLCGDDGVIFFTPMDEPGDWDGHFMITRPGKAVLWARQALRAMIATGARRIFGATPESHTRALRAAFGAGMRYVGKRDGYHITRYCNE